MIDKLLRKWQNRNKRHLAVLEATEEYPEYQLAVERKIIINKIKEWVDCVSIVILFIVFTAVWLAIEGWITPDGSKW